MQEIGRITLLQVQKSKLVIEDLHQVYDYYDPTPLLVVESLQLSPEGVIGITADGGKVMDVHHMHHPHSCNIKGSNGVSLGFTSHYASMRKAFGEHLVDGVAGENIIVAADAILTLADLGKRLVIQTQSAGQSVYLTRLKVATPCIEFSQFAANAGMPMPAQQLKATLQFLNEGRRGFYAIVAASNDDTTIRVGDRVLADDND